MAYFLGYSGDQQAYIEQINFLFYQKEGVICFGILRPVIKITLVPQNHLFRVYANVLREAVSKVLNIHWQVVIVTYQVDGGVEQHYLEEKMPRIGIDTDSSSWLKH